MPAFSKMFKAALGEAAEGTAKTTTKKAALEALKKTAQQEFGTGIKESSKEALLAQAKQGIKNIAVEEAREAAKTTFGYTAQAVAKQNAFFKGPYLSAVEHIEQQLKNGQLTKMQADVASTQIQENLAKKTLERQVAGTGPSETLLVPRQDETSLFLNDFVANFDERTATLPVENKLYIQKEAVRNPEKARWLAGLEPSLKQKGKYDNLLKYPMNFMKNAMLATNQINRLADAGGNIIMRGTDLMNLGTAELLSNTGEKLAEYLPYSVFRDVIHSPGVYAGETIQNINGMASAAKDSIVQGFKNGREFIRANKNGIKETVIGKNARKIDYMYNWNRNSMFSDVFVPKDISTMFHYMKQHPLKSAYNTYEFLGYGEAQLADDLTGGAFRAGSLAQHTYSEARRRLDQKGIKYSRKDVQDIQDVLIAEDMGEPVPADKLEKFRSFFTRDEEEAMLDLVSRLSSYDAAKSTYRTPPETVIGRWASGLDRALIKMPYGVGYVYDAIAPLARLTFHVMDRAIKDSPFIALKDLWKEYRIAATMIKETGVASSREFYKAFGRLVNASLLYAMIYKMKQSGFLTGKRPDDKQKAAIFDELGLKENSAIFFDEKGNVEGTVRYDKWGTAGYAMGAISYMIDGIDDAMANYDNPTKPYGIPTLALNIVETLLLSPLWDTAFAEIIEHSNLGETFEGSLKNMAKVLPRIESNIEQTTGMKPKEYVNKILLNYDKELSDYKITAIPKRGMFGELLKDGESPEGKHIAKIMSDYGVTVTDPEMRSSATVNEVDITLSPMQKAMWKKAMNEFYVDMGGYKEKRSVLQMMNDAINSEEFKFATDLEYTKDATGEIVKMAQQRKQDILTETYNEGCKKAFEYFLSMKDKISKDKETKRMIDEAINLWKKSIETKTNFLYKPKGPIIPSLSIK